MSEGFFKLQRWKLILSSVLLLRSSSSFLLSHRDRPPVKITKEKKKRLHFDFQKSWECSLLFIVLRSYLSSPGVWVSVRMGSEASLCVESFYSPSGLFSVLFLTIFTLPELHDMKKEQSGAIPLFCELLIQKYPAREILQVWTLTCEFDLQK